MRAKPTDTGFVCEGLDHPECVAFDRDGTMYAGGEAGQIYRIDASTSEFQCIAQTGGFILGITHARWMETAMCTRATLAERRS